MSIDVEDYFQVWAFSDVIDRKSWDEFSPRVERTTRKALDLLERTGTKATFFTLGWVAERFPDLIRDIVARGHELASHGYDHAKVFDLTELQFRKDAGQTKALLEDISGIKVIGYRAPGFSISGKSPWAYEVLADLGYQYSSSSHPISHDHYGDPSGDRAPFTPLGERRFIEAPVATTELFGRRISCAGGGWFRAVPYAVSKRLIEHASNSASGPMIFYFHPWEIDPMQPRIENASVKSRVRHYLNLPHMEGKLERLLRDFSWGRIDEALGLCPVKVAA